MANLQDQDEPREHAVQPDLTQLGKDVAEALKTGNACPLSAHLPGREYAHDMIQLTRFGSLPVEHDRGGATWEIDTDKSMEISFHTLREQVLSQNINVNDIACKHVGIKGVSNVDVHDFSKAKVVTLEVLLQVDARDELTIMVKAVQVDGKLKILGSFDWTTLTPSERDELRRWPPGKSAEYDLRIEKLLEKRIITKAYFKQTVGRGKLVKGLYPVTVSLPHKFTQDSIDQIVIREDMIDSVLEESAIDSLEFAGEHSNFLGIPGHLLEKVAVDTKVVLPQHNTKFMSNISDIDIFQAKWNEEERLFHRLPGSLRTFRSPALEVVRYSQWAEFRDGHVVEVHFIDELKQRMLRYKLHD